MKRQMKLILGIIVVVVIAVAVIIAISFAGKSGDDYSMHMEQAAKYLNELEYEKAIAEYQAAIEIDPMDADTYLKLAEIYAEMGDIEAAMEVLNQGIAQTESEELISYLEELAETGDTASGDDVTAETEQPEDVVESETTYNTDNSYFVHEYANGIETKRSFYYADATLSWYMLMEYDESGNRVSQTYYDASGAVLSSIKNEYDASGNVVKKSNFDGEGNLSFYYVYEYDTTGEMVKETYCDVEGNLSTVHEYEGDEYTRLLYYQDGELVTDTYFVYEYNESGQVVKQNRYNTADGTFVEYGVYEYDAQGNETKATYYYDSEVRGEYVGYYNVYEYDESGHRTKHYYYYAPTMGDGSVTWYIEYVNDRNGKVVLSHQFYGNGQVNFGEYDGEDNFVKSINHAN